MARFTHAFVRYEEESLPSRYLNQMIAINPLQRYVLLSSFDRHGSTFSNTDGSRILETTDPWFRPVEARTGPDGALWIVDMYRYVIEHPRWIPEETLATLDVRAGSDRGRIYRVLPGGGEPRRAPDGC